MSTDPAPLPSGRDSEHLAALVAEFENAIAHPERYGLTDDQVQRLRRARHSLLIPVDELPAPPRIVDRHTMRWRRR